MSQIDEKINTFYEAMRGVLSQMDLETAQEFMRLFNEKLGKLDEQKCTQENSGASR